MVLDLLGLVERRLGILVRLVGSLVRDAGEDVLANHDDREHDQLDERLADPLDEGEQSTADSLRHDQEGKEGERVRTPHRPDRRRQGERDLSVDADMFVSRLRRAGLLALGDPRMGMVLEVDLHDRSPR
jgi:hypothetical protein